MHLTRRPVLFLLVVSLGVHACVLTAARLRTGRLDGYAFRSLDSREYYQTARNVAKYATFSRDESPPLAPDTWRTPGYPLFLALLIFVFGESPAMLVVAQQLVSVLNVMLLYVIARRFMTPRRAMAAALMMLLEPYHLFYSLWLLSATLFVTVLLLTWHVWHIAVESRKWRRFACLGLLCGFLVLVRPVAAIVPIVILAGVVCAVASPRRREGRRTSM